MSDFSIATYTASGASNVQYAVPYGFISRDHVLVLTAYNKSTGAFALELEPGTGFLWVNDTTIEIPALAAGTVFSIVRQTPKDLPLVNWVAGGGALTAEELRLSSLQTLYVAQENADRGLATAADAEAAAAQAAEAAANALEAQEDAAAALDAATDAESKADAAVSTANAASSAASAATSTANAAAADASEALATANAASAAADSAVDTADAANDKADAAIAAVVSSVNYIAIATVAQIPATPTNNTYIEVLDSTGLESFTPLAGMPVGFVGDSGLRVRMRYTSSGSTWNWIDYAAKDPEGRYIRQTSISTSTSSSSTTTVASSSAVKAAKDAADAAQGAANAAQTTANAALPKAGGTMTGAITFAGGQAFPGAVTSVSGTAPISVTAGTTPTVSVGAASTSAAGVVQLSTSTSSTSTTQAATPSAVKTVQDFVQVVSTTANAAMPKAGGTFTGDIVVPSINSGPLAGFRNAIINGNFDVWQRGTSFTGNEYGADRWSHGRVGTTHTVTRQAFTLGQTAVPGEPQYFCRTVVASVAGSGNYSNIAQFIEDVRTFAGQQVTVSFWAKADASKPIAVELAQSFGTGGSPSSQVTAIVVQKTTLSTNWQKITVTTTLPSISGKTLGSDGNSNLRLNIWFDAGSNFNSRTNSLGQQSGTFDIAQVQVEPGPIATPFERRPIGTELALCQRYLIRWGASRRIAVVARGVVNSSYRAATTLPVALRGSGTLTWNDVNITQATTSTAVTSFSNFIAEGHVLSFDPLVPTTGLDAGHVATGAAGFFQIDAEL